MRISLRCSVRSRFLRCAGYGYVGGMAQSIILLAVIDSITPVYVPFAILFNSGVKSDLHSLSEVKCLETFGEVKPGMIGHDLVGFEVNNIL